jgi:putative heme-binding domain-containing protein
MACHAIGGAGGKLGPDLTSIGASAPADYLVESLLNPNAKIKEGYHSVLISTRDGQEHSGMIQRETATEVLMRDVANKEVSIPIQAIARRTSVGSLMPAGLIDALLPDERLDLIKFMAQLGKPGDFDASKGGVARTWKLYLVQSSNQHLGVERVVAGEFSLRDWVPTLSLTNGVLPARVIEAAYSNRGNNRGLFAATQFHSAGGGTVAFTVAGSIKDAWLNGVTVKPGARLQLAVKPGLNTLVLQLDASAPSDVKLTSADVSFVGP